MNIKGISTIAILYLFAILSFIILACLYYFDKEDKSSAFIFSILALTNGFFFYQEFKKSN